MNYHTDKWIMDRVREHYEEALTYFPKEQILGCFYQGSGNYGLDYINSDVDTKLIVLPSFSDFALNKSPISTTHVRQNNEHTDWKDIRLMHDCFKKQNINFLEILFTKYKIINPEYASLYQPMFNNAEKIAHYNNYKAVNSIAGMVFEKRKALCHPYEGLKDKIEKYGYDNKQLHHILRCEEFLKRYIDGTPYSECLIPTDPQHLIDVKASYIYSVDEAVEIADNVVEIVKDVKQKYMDTHEVEIDNEVDSIMNNVLINILKYSFKKEIKE